MVTDLRGANRVLSLGHVYGLTPVDVTSMRAFVGAADDSELDVARSYAIARLDELARALAVSGELVAGHATIQTMQALRSPDSFASDVVERLHRLAGQWADYRARHHIDQLSLFDL